MEYSPPPLFKQGPSALARLIFFVVLSLALLISDARFMTLEIVRGVLGAGGVCGSVKRRAKPGRP